MTSIRPERLLGWVRPEEQRYPTEVAADWLDAVEKGLCPFCGNGPFIVPAIHASKKHGIDRYEFREWIGVSKRESICDPTHSALVRARAQEQATKAWSGKDGYQKSLTAKRLDTIEQRTEEMAKLFKGGMTIKAISSETGYCVNTVRNWLHRLGHVEDARVAGLPSGDYRKGPKPERQWSHCKRGHELMVENLVVTKDGSRQCRTCSRLRGREYDRKRLSGSVRQRLARG